MNKFDKVIGYKNIKAELIRISDMLNNREKYAKLGVTMPKGLLLHGEPGTGKSLMCSCFIDSCNVNTYICRKDKPNGTFINEIKEKFDQAIANEPSIVFLDDMDKFANSDERRRNAEEYVTIQACIDEAKSHDVYVIATVNAIDLLPDSLVRAGRFDKVIRVKPPRGQDAIDIVNYYLSKKSVVGDVDAKSIARLLGGRSCAELETVINEAGIRAAYNGKDFIDMDDIIRACLRVIYRAPECIEQEDKNNTEKVACHEAGHAVVAEVLHPGMVNIVSVLRNSGNTGGITAYMDDTPINTSIQLMEDRILCLLGGRAATEVVYGEIDAGTTNDIERATSLVDDMIGYLCTLGFDKVLSRNESEDVYNKERHAVGQELEKYYQKAKQIIINNRELHSKITKELLQKEVITYKDIEALRKKKAA